MESKKEVKILSFLTNLVTKPVTVQQPQTKIIPKGIKRGLLIGINYIDNPFNKLNGCINDVNNIKALLVNKFMYNPTNITILTDDGKSNGIPTKMNIIQNINTLISLTKSGDTIYLHYSGHGSQVIATNGDESKNQDTMGMDDCICPCDFNKFIGSTGFVTDNELRELLVDKIPKGAKLRAFFDACHSGSMLDLEYVWKNNEVFVKEHLDEKLSSDILLISGCKDSQTSADTFNLQQKQSQGALTMMLIKALTSDDILKRNWKNLVLRVKELLIKGGYSQTPMLSVGDKPVVKKVIDL